MCGIAGIISLTDEPVPFRRIKSACDSISHRGPDDAGYVFFGPNWNCAFKDEEFFSKNPAIDILNHNSLSPQQTRTCYLALGHRRLSVIDLSDFAHQPMSTDDGRYWIVYNGEIYNFRNLKTSLALDYEFKSTSDTEVILAMWKKSGPDTLCQLNGMFAFAIYDNLENRLWLVRDRFGIKPLYYAETDKYLIFSSEIKAIFATEIMKAEISPENLYEYFTFQNILNKGTLFKSVELLSPGTIMELIPGKGIVSVSKYFDNSYILPLKMRAKNASDTTVKFFENAVSRQLVSDVEVGAYLSGGMDSGSIVSVAAKRLNRLLSFTCGFDLTNVNGIEQGFDERRLAEELSYLFQTEHYDVVLHAGDMPAAMEKISWHMDDPRVGMCHQNWYVAKLASRFVKVCLSGTGGDELFGGYPWRYSRFFNQQYEKLDDALFKYWHRLLPGNELKNIFSNSLRKFSEKRIDSFHELMSRAPKYSNELSKIENILQRILYFEFNSFLHGLLITEDKISMAHSLEVRVPFLDNDLANFALSLSPSFKVNITKKNKENFLGYYTSKEGKVILRKAMRKFLPYEFTCQHKQGFSPPDENWFRGPSMAYIKDILFSNRALSRPWFNKKEIRRHLNEHFSGKKNNRLLIWSLLSFEWLQRHYIDK